MCVCGRKRESDFRRAIVSHNDLFVIPATQQTFSSFIALCIYLHILCTKTDLLVFTQTDARIILLY